jgi:hypothetical protein
MPVAPPAASPALAFIPPSPMTVPPELVPPELVPPDLVPALEALPPAG